MSEKRKQLRFEVCLTARWRGSSAHQTVRISDLSEGGCYVDTIVEVTVNEAIWIDIAMPDATWLKLNGIVAHHFPRLGFGVRFVDLDEEQLRLLRSLLPLIHSADSSDATPSLDDSATKPTDDLLPVDDTQLASRRLM